MDSVVFSGKKSAKMQIYAVPPLTQGEFLRKELTSGQWGKVQSPCTRAWSGIQGCLELSLDFLCCHPSRGGGPEQLTLNL